MEGAMEETKVKEEVSVVEKVVEEEVEVRMGEAKETVKVLVNLGAVVTMKQVTLKKAMGMEKVTVEAKEEVQVAAMRAVMAEARECSEREVEREEVGKEDSVVGLVMEEVAKEDFEGVVGREDS